MTGTLCEIRFFAGNYAPENWKLCNGELLKINDYQDLHSLLGALYGGDNKVTFGLPDFRGRAPIGAGQGPGLTDRPLAQKLGKSYIPLKISEIPSHTHDVSPYYTRDTYANSPDMAFLGNVGQSIYGIESAGNMGQAYCDTVGGSNPHNNIQPTLCMNYIICVKGAFPSRQ